MFSRPVRGFLTKEGISMLVSIVHNGQNDIGVYNIHLSNENERFSWKGYLHNPHVQIFDNVHFLLFPADYLYSEITIWNLAYIE